MSKTSSFFRTWVAHAHKHINPFGEQNSNLELLQNRQFIDLMERAPCVVFIINHASSRYEFFSKNVREVMGYTSEEMIAGGVPFGMSLCHESQREILAGQVIPRLFHFFKEFSERKELKKVKAAYNFKYYRKDGQVRWTLHQMSVIEMDENGGPLLSMVFMTDVTTLKKDDKIDFTVSKLSDEGYYEPFFTTNFPDGSRAELTPREWEIVTLINAGKTSAEIADGLHLSVHTVKTHRKNILEKFEANNTAHLLDIFRRKGLV